MQADISSNFQDIIEKLQQDITDLQQRFDFCIEHVADGMWELDLVNNRIFLSAKLLDLLGLAPESSIDVTAFFKRIHPNDLYHFALSIRDKATETTNDAVTLQHKLQINDDEYITVNNQIKVTFANNQAARLTGIITRTTNETETVTDIDDELHLHSVLNCMSEAMIVLDTDHNLIYCNPSFSAIFSTTLDNIEQLSPASHSWKAITPEGVPYPKSLQPALRTLRTGKSVHDDIQGVLTQEGEYVWVSCNSEPLFNKTADEIVGVVVTFTDISERLSIEETLRLSSKVFEHCHEAIVIADQHYNILRVNNAFKDAYTHIDRCMIGEPLSSLFTFESDTCDVVREHISTHGHWSGEHHATCPVNGKKSELISITRDTSQIGLGTHYIVIITDISEQQAALEQIHYLAYYDCLTGLPNRLNMQKLLQDSINAAQANKASLSTMLIDLDRFKVINDTLGHAVGDQLLTLAAARFKSVLRNNDIICRIVGDEFIAIIHNANPKKASATAKRIIDAFKNPFVIDNKKLNVTTSIGISFYPQDSETLEQMIQHADSAMYHAKANGRNNYHCFDQQINAQTKLRNIIEAGLHEAIRNNQISLHFQPQLNTDTGEIIGAEALLRWEHPEHGKIPPSLFIPIAEECGLIVSIGNWVIHEVCRLIKRWKESKLNYCSISINLSARQFIDSNLIESIHQALEFNAIDSKDLEFEITETTLMVDEQATLRNIEGIHQIGSTISIDDFGIGYSNLSYLKRFPIHSLKIDQSFIKNICIDTGDSNIVNAMIGLAKNLNLAIVAEGVETKEQLNTLQSSGCSNIQGFLYSQPLSADQFERFLHTNRSALLHKH